MNKQTKAVQKQLKSIFGNASIQKELILYYGKGFDVQDEEKFSQIGMIIWDATFTVAESLEILLEDTDVAEVSQFLADEGIIKPDMTQAVATLLQQQEITIIRIMPY